MKTRFLIVLVIAALAGTVQHLLYDLCPNLVTALLAPINESVWEHLKLLFWPTLCAAAALSAFTQDRISLWSGFLPAQLIMPLFFLGANYLLSACIGGESTVMQVILYYVTMAGGFLLAWQLYKSGCAERYTGIALMLVILYGSTLILFTFAAPPAGIFIAP